MRDAQHTLLHQLGGRSVLDRVHKRFYDAVYADDWMGPIFMHVPQDLIESQQTNFMAARMGGENLYCGLLPKWAHRHILITHEMMDHRHRLLAEALDAERVDSELAQRWLRIDEAFRSALVKKSAAECVQRFKSEPIVTAPKPGCSYFSQHVR